MNEVKKHYERYWKDKKENFFAYDRNLVLDQFFSEGEKVLDLGCGDGAVSEYLQSKLKVKVVGVDISIHAIREAKKRGIDAKVVDAEDKLPFDSETFDIVFWGDNIEHLFSPIKVAKEIKRVLKNGGRVIVSCPNIGYWRYRFLYLLKGRLPDTEWTGLPPWQWSHIRFFSIDLLHDFFKEAGFEQIKTVVGVSSRRIDKVLLPFSTTLFGMVLVVEVI